jgi:Arc/MetJ-type ribon-helix-helix transcriptional regulator
MTQQLAIRIPTEQLQQLDVLIKRGLFANRTEALRAALARLLADARDEAIADSYRRGYERHPQEEWVGQAGADLLAAAAAAQPGTGEDL